MLMYELSQINNDIPEAGGISPRLASLLYARGARDREAMELFLHPGEGQFLDPLLMKDMDKALERIKRAVAGEKICVYGDYDADGVCATSILYDCLKSMGADVIYDIPSRHDEGYGLNIPAVERLHGMGVQLIVTVDNGVKAYGEIDRCRELGMDVVVTDHHRCDGRIPDCCAVVCHTREDDTYPNGDICGAGIAWKLAEGLIGREAAKRYLPQAGIATMADVVPLLGENRFITRCGLRKIAAGDCRPGFLALAEEAGVRDKPFTASTVSFSLAPRINAAGRLGEPGLAVRLLEETDPLRARALAAELCEKNRERQALETEIWREAVERLHGERPDAPIVLAAENWHPGVIGIVASRMTDAYSVPAVMICLDGENGKGSCRSTGSFNLFEALSACSDCLEGFGGHAMAAGVTVHRSRVDELRERLRDYYLSHPDRTLPALEADLLVDSPELLTMACVESLDEL